MPASPAVRSLNARAAAFARWAKVSDPAAETAKARQAFADRFERQVDPDNQLSAPERTRRAAAARKAYFANLAAKSVKARQAKAS